MGEWSYLIGDVRYIISYLTGTESVIHIGGLYSPSMERVLVHFKNHSSISMPIRKMSLDDAVLEILIRSVSL